MGVKLFDLEIKVAEHLYGALLLHYKYASGIDPAHQVTVWSAVETQARSRCTVLKSAIPYQTELYSGNEALEHSDSRIQPENCKVTFEMEFCSTVNIQD